MSTWAQSALAAAVHPPNHAVQFYEDDAFLVESVVAYLAKGLRARQPAIVVATSDHLRAFEAGLTRAGIDVGALTSSGELLLLDARRTLERIMVGGMPDPGRFAGVVGSVVTGLQGPRGTRTVVAYGEMVDLLWQAGQAAAALQLEGLWNELAATCDLSLLCAYAMSHFHDATHAEAFGDVCHHHTHVLPAESYTRSGTDAERSREIARLQQRARVLENEIAHRRELEQQLREAVRARDDFISIASHELRNPVHAFHLQVIGALHTAKAEGGQEAVCQRLGRAADQVTRLARLLDNLLDVSRITAGRVELELEDTDLSEVVKGVAERFRDQLAGMDVTLRLESLVGRWDPLRLDQIVSNLLSNAVKYGGGHPIVISVERDGDTAVFRVQDHGAGIAPVDLERVFARFERAVSPRRVGGFGLGLWITRQIVEAMGGSIAVDSATGQGSVFSVTLPCAESRPI